MPWNPYTPAENITSILDLLSYGNTVTDNAFGLTISFSIFAICMIALYGRVRKAEGIMYSSFITMILSIFLFIPGLVADWTIVLFMVMTLGSVLADAAYRRYISV